MDYDLTSTQELICRLVRRHGMWNADETRRIMDETFPDHPEWREIALDALAAEAPMLWHNDEFPNNPTVPVYIHQDFDPKVTEEFIAVLLYWYGMEDTTILAEGFARPDWKAIADYARANNPLSDDMKARIRP